MDEYTAKLAEAASMLGASAPEVTGIDYCTCPTRGPRLDCERLRWSAACRTKLKRHKEAKLDSDFWCSLFLTAVCVDSGVAWLCRQPDDRITDAAEET